MRSLYTLRYAANAGLRIAFETRRNRLSSCGTLQTDAPAIDYDPLIMLEQCDDFMKEKSIHM